MFVVNFRASLICSGVEELLLPYSVVVLLQSEHFNWALTSNKIVCTLETYYQRGT